jgi:hypothetical protein
MKRILALTVSGYFCNTWPTLKIISNDEVCFDGEIINKQLITLTLDSLKQNNLYIKLTNKSLGENNIWDTSVNELNEIVSDKFIKIEYASLADVDITDLIYKSPYTIDSSNSITTTHNGLLNFNGSIAFQYDEPVLDFLINAKYKTDIDTSKSYFSNNTYLFHYDMEVKLISRIRKLLDDDI